MWDNYFLLDVVNIMSACIRCSFNIPSYYIKYIPEHENINLIPLQGVHIASKIKFHFHNLGLLLWGCFPT